MRRPVIAGNWKLHKTVSEALELANALKEAAADVRDADIIVAPVFTSLGSVCAVLDDSNVAVAAQNCYPEPSGAFTGEVSPPLLRDIGCRYVIVGHSERRQIFAENDAFINAKIRAALEAGLTPILCIGETLEERDEGRMFDVLGRQVAGGLEGLSADQMKNLIVAYEPVWAIGTGKTASDDQAEEAHAYIRKLLRESFGGPTADATRILYGGSVKPGNVDGLMARENIDGTLVGGASLKAEDFSRIIHFKRN
jgi:triosephosphate isomerase